MFDIAILVNCKEILQDNDKTVQTTASYKGKKTTKQFQQETFEQLKKAKQNFSAMVERTFTKFSLFSL